METTISNNVKKEISIGEILISRVYASEYQKEGTITAELKQTVTTDSYYPTKSVTNSLQDNIFETKDYGFEEKAFKNAEVRVAWIDVPVGTTMEQVAEKLKAHPEANLYRVMSNKPIVADTELYAINNPELDVTMDTFANRQAVRYPEGTPEAGQLALDTKGKIQYRRIAFSSNGMVDQDSRTSDPADFYASPELKAELNETVHVIAEQKL